MKAIPSTEQQQPGTFHGDNFRQAFSSRHYGYWLREAAIYMRYMETAIANDNWQDAIRFGRLVGQFCENARKERERKKKTRYATTR